MAANISDFKQYFPLKTVEAVLDLCRKILTGNSEPNLAFLSILLGVIENRLTCNRSATAVNKNSGAGTSPPQQLPFPTITYTTVESLFTKFESQIKGSVDVTKYDGKYASREFVKKVSDVIWGSLARTYYKDKAHLQTLYSYLTGNCLDCFGVAFGVVAACQLLGANDTHLTLSEDHAWVTFGEKGDETAEVTWHGRATEDKRGEPISAGLAERSWIYLNGEAVLCNRHLEVSALVAAINPSITTTVDSREMSDLQQELLWMLYDHSYLKRYPIALGILGDMEEIKPTASRLPARRIYEESIRSAQTYHKNMHVYPYTYLAGHCFRQGLYKEAMKNWANAANVIRKYNYTREDEEVYNEFREIANESIPYILKTSSAALASRKGDLKASAGLYIIDDPECYAYFLQFYDGICEWEEGSPTPVLHITWAQHLVHSVGKFLPPARTTVKITVDVAESNGGENKENKHDGAVSSRKAESDAGVGTRSDDTLDQEGESKTKGKKQVVEKEILTRSKRLRVDSVDNDKTRGEEPGAPPTPVSTNPEKKKVESKQKDEADSESGNMDLLPGMEGNDSTDITTSTANIAALAAACGDSILNPEYLVGGLESRNEIQEYLSSRSNNTTFPGMTIDSVMKAESPAEKMLNGKDGQGSSIQIVTSQSGRPVLVQLKLSSAKMNGVKELLTVEKLNTSAIELQLTAQSQVQVVKRVRVTSDFEYVSTSTRKRPKRE